MEKFYLGLDVGTDSVGIACSDEEYKLLRAKGKDLWAVRLFDQAKTAAERRVKRTARRRMARRARRLQMLREIFAPFINDELFFLRLENSGFLYEDKDEKLQSPYSLFADENFSDKDFYKKYPTVFHLRKALIEGNQKQDIRLYYLAIHHIMKYRGHFLYEEQKMSEVRDIGRLFLQLNTSAEEIFYEDAPIFDSLQADKFKEFALQYSGNDRKIACLKLLDADTPKKREIVTLMLGGKGKPAIIFDNNEYKDESFSFKTLADEEFDSKEEIFGEDFTYLKAIKNIYDYIVFEHVLMGNEYISDAMIDIYNRHKKHLRQLKDLLIADYSHDTYVKVFKSVNENCNYVNYIGYTKIGKKKVNVKKCKADDFLKYLKKILLGERQQETRSADYEEILANIDNAAFLPKILNADNGRFPHQINFDELEHILKNLCRDYPQFEQSDKDGLNAAEKIRKLFLFRIPYYVGPLNTHGENSWMVRKKEGKITPWNFDEMVDDAASNESFMRRMTNKCSYLYNENVLPKASILYQKFDVLNQLNNLKINELPISVNLKQDIYNDLFLCHKRITDRMIRAYLVNKGLFPQQEESQIALSGKDGDFKASMSSYLVFKKILGDFTDKHLDICEDIILWHTLNTNKNIVERLITENYGHIPEIAENIKKLKGISSFKDFGRLSKKLLCELKCGINFETGEVYNLLDTLYNTNKNFNQILFDENYKFNEIIAEENGISEEEISIESLKEMGLAPQVRRGVWQALKMTDEYVTALNRVPDKIFVEVIRSNNDKQKGNRTLSRKNQLLDLYKTAKDIDYIVKELNREEITNSELRSERLYLYFKQLGKCAYTGERIKLDELSGELYDVDHILPQSLTKDDSLDNKVLVLRKCNAEKSDEYPVPEKFRNMKPFWKQLKDMGLMSEKKFSLLTRTEPLQDEDFKAFINRQIVVTGQTAKAVVELLKRKYNTQVIYSKAENVADFRNRFSIVKCRDTNDLHHARDAYLNIAVGNVYNTKFPYVHERFYKKGDVQHCYNLNKLFNNNIEGVWDTKKSLDIVKSTLLKSSMTVTRYAFTEKGEFYNETLYGKGENIDVPRKNIFPYNEVEKYGGYKSLTTAYFAIVESEGKKGKIIKTIERIPVLIDYRVKSKPTAIIDYLVENVGLVNPKIIVSKIKMKTLVEVGGTPVYIAGLSNDSIIVHNAIQWFTDAQTDIYVKALGKLNEWKKSGKLSEKDSNNEVFVMNTNRFNEVKLEINRENNVNLFNKIINQINKPIYKGIAAANTFFKNLSEGKTKFIELSVFEQTQVLLQCVKYLKCNAELSDLSLLGYSKNSGKLTINKNITDTNFVIIHTSPCGLTVRRQKI